MSHRSVQQNNALSKRLSEPRLPMPRWTHENPGQEWVRNPSWLTWTAVGASEQKFVGLFAVYPRANFVAFRFTSAITIDWGDGTAPENVATNITAYHEYDYSDGDLANTNGPVTFTASTDLVNRTAHGYTNGMRVTFYDVVTTTAVVSGQKYYVINANANDFQVSATFGGSAINLDADGSATLLPYKQAIISITPQASNNIVTFTLDVRHSTPTGIQHNNHWLDIECGSPNCTSMTFSGTSTVFHTLLERVIIRSVGTITSCSSMFAYSAALESVSLFNTASCTSFASMFIGCNRLKNVPVFNTVAGTSFAAMFNSCYSLETVPLFNTVAATSFASMFSNCYKLKSVPLFNTALVTSFASMFSGCTALEQVPLFNTVAGTTFDSMFSSCYSLKSCPPFNTSAGLAFGQMFSLCTNLQSVPLLNTASGTVFSYMFQYCYILPTIPLLNTALGTNFSNMFNSCYSLKTIPLLNTVLGTNFSSMFANCTSLREVPLLNTAAGTNFAAMFSTCRSLEVVPAMNFNAVTSSANLTSIFNNCSSLAKILATGLKYTFSIASCKLSAVALDEIYTNLPSVSSQTITVSSNYGTTGDDPTIATAKGWTVTG